MQRQAEQKQALKSMRSISKGLHKVFKTVVKEISQELSLLGEFGSEVFHFIPEPQRSQFSHTDVMTNMKLLAVVTPLSTYK